MHIRPAEARDDDAIWRIIGRLKDAFRHPRLGYVDALVMQRTL